MLTGDQQAALNAITLRLGTVQVKTYKQFVEMRKALIKVLDSKGNVLYQEHLRQQAQKMKDKVEQAKYQDQFRLAWCKANLKNEDVVKTRHTVGAHVVGQLTDSSATLLKGGSNSTDVPFEAITKILIDGEWKDIYKLAAKG